MAINALRGRADAADKPRSEAPAIGEDDANIIDCPVCKRPLDAANRRCPGCGTRLVYGVQGSKAAMFVSFGLAVGLIGGATAMGLAATRAGAVATTVTPQPTAIVTATVAPVPSGVTASPALPGVSAAALTALRGTATVNAWIAATSAPLAAELASSDLDTQAVAKILRDLTFEAGAAQSLLPSLGEWQDATAVRAQLDDFYGRLLDASKVALSASIHNDAAYRSGASSVLGLIGGLAKIDDASRGLARTAGIDLPQVVATP
jgi:hypothetical protein